MEEEKEMSMPIRTMLVLVTLLAGFLPSFTTATAQLLIPIDPRLPPPPGFDFKGKWACGEGSSTAHLAVAVRPSTAQAARPALLEPWTEVRESQDGFSGLYFVGYNLDKSQFLMIDAADPSSVSYQTSGWQGSKLVLVALTGEAQLPTRLKFEVMDVGSFTVTWETLDGAAWKEEPSFTCRRLANRDQARRKP